MPIVPARAVCQNKTRDFGAFPVMTPANPPDNSRSAPVEIVGIVNSFDRLALLQEGLPSLVAALRECGRAGAVVVFDAGSSDGSHQWVEDFARENAEQNGDVPVVQLLCAPGEPSTFSDGINRACDEALARFPNLKWFFLFETDNWISGAAPLQMALELAQTHDDVGAVGFTVARHDGSRAGYGSRFPTLAEFALGPQFATRLPARELEVAPLKFERARAWQSDVVYTSPLLLRRVAWEQTGGLDAGSFPFSDCDVDWAWRARDLGWKQAVIEAKGVVHDNRQTASQWSQSRVFHFHRGRMHLLRRHRKPRLGWLKIALVLRHFAEIAVLAAMPQRPHQRANIAKRWRLLRRVAREYRAPGQGPLPSEPRARSVVENQK